MSLSRFRTRFPEMKNAPDQLISLALATAANSVHESVWGDDRDEGLDYLAAHNIALGPGGYGVRTESKGSGWSSTVYGQRFASLMRKVTLRAPRVVG